MHSTILARISCVVCEPVRQDEIKKLLRILIQGQTKN